MTRNTISNITKKELLLSTSNYLWLEIPDEYSNINFSLLLDFIEKYSDYGKDRLYGNAYYIIRKESNKLFGVGRYSPRKLKISKHEIKSIRNSFISRMNHRTYIKIPYKISYIFKAIISIVEKIKTENNVTLSADLQHTINLTYKIAFYQKPVAVYDAYFQDLYHLYLNNNGYYLKIKLNDDFHSKSSIFNTIVQ